MSSFVGLDLPQTPSIDVVKILLFSCGFLVLSIASAQEADTIQLREILISARTNPSDSLPYLSLQAPVQSMDLLERLPGVVRAQVSAFPVSYRGQTGSRLRIQQNGARRSGLNPQGYLAQDLNVANLSVARIVQGIEKAIYGSGAIGGVLILEDRQAFEKTKNVIHSQFATNNNARQLGFRGNGAKERFSIEVAGNAIATDDFRFDQGQKLLNSAIHELQLSAAVTGKMKKTRIDWRQKWSAGRWQFPQGFQNNPFELRELDNAYTYQTDVKVIQPYTNGWGTTHQLWGLALRTNQLQNQFNAQFDAINFQIERSYDRHGFGYNGIAEKHFDRYAIKTGLDVFASRLNENRTEKDAIRNTSFSSLVARRDDRQAGTFLKAKTLGRNVQWSGVFRADLAQSNNLDANKSHTAAWSGGLEADWSMGTIDHQMTLGRYFRFPRPEESGGELFGGRGTFRGNPDIRPEFSHQLEWTMAKSTEATSFQISSWLAYYENRIIEVPIPEEIQVFQYMNIDRARTFGVAWQLSQVLLDQNKHHLKGRFSGMAMQGDDLTNAGLFAKGSRSNGIPPVHFESELRYKTWLGAVPLQFEGEVRHFMAFKAPTGFTNQVWAVQDALAYTLVGLHANARLQWNQNALLISISAANLADQVYYPFGTRIPGMGRDFRFGVNFSF